MSRTTSRQTSRKLAGAGTRSDRTPQIDKARELHEAIIEDAGETEDRGRDLAQGEGGAIDLPTKPGDMSKDD